jgi:hypothetical protein
MERMIHTQNALIRHSPFRLRKVETRKDANLFFDTCICCPLSYSDDMLTYKWDFVSRVMPLEHIFIEPSA